jgi:hypothetical protein
MSAALLSPLHEETEPEGGWTPTAAATPVNDIAVSMADTYYISILIVTSPILYRGAIFACQGVFCIVLHRKTGAGDAILGGRWMGDRSFEKSVHLFVESPAKQAFLSTIRQNLSGTPFLMRRYAGI